MALVAEDVRDEEPYRAMLATSALHAVLTALVVDAGFLNWACAELKKLTQIGPAATTDRGGE